MTFIFLRFQVLALLHTDSSSHFRLVRIKWGRKILSAAVCLFVISVRGKCNCRLCCAETRWTSWTFGEYFPQRICTLCWCLCAAFSHISTFCTSGELWILHGLVGQLGQSSLCCVICHSGQIPQWDAGPGSKCQPVSQRGVWTPVMKKRE